MCKFLVALLLAISAFIMGGMATLVLPDIDQLSPGDSLGGNFPASLTYVGSVDGKSYFADTTRQQHWRDAVSHCYQLGLRLATITSAEQLSLLEQSFGDHFDGRFWTSGRDAQEIRQFSWNSDGAALDSDFLNLTRINSAYMTCVIYHSVEGWSGLESLACFEPDVFSLCETGPV